MSKHPGFILITLLITISTVARLSPAKATAFETTTTDSDQVTVETGDNLWKIAEEFLGGGKNYPQITGFHSGNPSVILPGEKLNLNRKSAVACTDTLKEDLIGKWELNEGKGNIAVDSSGQNHNGTWYGSGEHWAKGKFDSAGQFNEESSDYISIPGGTDFCPPNLSVSIWLKPAQRTDAYKDHILYLFKTPTEGDQTDSWELVHQAWANNSVFGINNSMDAKANLVLRKDAWYNLVGIYDQKQIKIYLNGKLYSSQPYSTEMGCSGGDLQIGRKYVPVEKTGKYYFSGQMDDVRIYKRALTPAEVETLFSKGSGCLP